MGLNKSAGNMYDFISHTFNTVKGKCFHDCSYCYVKSMMTMYGRKQAPVRFDEKELKTNLGEGNFIFVGSSCDMFARDIPDAWILATLRRCYDYRSNKYLFQTKNPLRVLDFNHFVLRRSVICTTIESDQFYPDIMGNSPTPIERAMAMEKISTVVDTYVTIEPIMFFNLKPMVELIKRCRPKQVNIGADSGRHDLPEPSKERILQLISELEKFTVIHKKTNLRRLL
jgi:DNA repair photolyase